MIKEKLCQIVKSAAEDACKDGRLGGLKIGDLPPVLLEKPRLLSHGDLCCGLALKLGSQLKLSPLTIAETLADYIELNKELAGGHITLFEVARPGFINFTLGSAWFGEIVSTIVRQGADYGKSQLGCGRRVLFCRCATARSPLTLTAHRATVFSETLSNLFAFCGFAVDSRDTLSRQALDHTYDVTIEIRQQADNVPETQPSSGLSEVFTAETVSSGVLGVDDLLPELGGFVLRFYLAQANCQAFQFDVDLARQCHQRNAAFAVQYAYARCGGLLRGASEPGFNESGFEPALIEAAQWSELIGQWGRPENFSVLFTASVNTHEQYQKDLISMLESFPELVRQSLYSRQPGRIAQYSADLAGLLDRYLASVNFYDDHLSVLKARLGLIFAVKQVLTNALGIIGLSAPEQM